MKPGDKILVPFGRGWDEGVVSYVSCGRVSVLVHVDGADEPVRRLYRISELERPDQ